MQELYRYVKTMPTKYCEFKIRLPCGIFNFCYCTLWCYLNKLDWYRNKSIQKYHYIDRFKINKIKRIIQLHCSLISLYPIRIVPIHVFTKLLTAHSLIINLRVIKIPLIMTRTTWVRIHYLHYHSFDKFTSIAFLQ